MENVTISGTISDYSSRVLGVIKEKFGLRTKVEAINKFAELYGEEFVEKEVKDEVAKKMVAECGKWEKTHNFRRKMTVKELDRLCEV